MTDLPENINQDTPTQDVASVVTSVDGDNGDLTASSEVQREKNHNNRRARLLNTEEMDGINILAMIFMMFVGNDAEKTKELSETLGIDLSAFTQTLQNVRAGHITPSAAATETYAAIDHSRVDWTKAANINIAELTRHDGPTVLHPNLIAKMEKDPKVAQMVEWTFEAAEREGIDGNLLANQFWQESRFNPNAQSGAGAKGIAQFMPFHKGKWGLDTAQDFFDPKTSIDAGARFMSHLTERTGSQQLAMVAYNGGEKAIAYVDKNMSNSEDLTISDWMGFMHQERETKGVGASNLWRNQTYEYIAKIDSAYWDPELLARANQSSNQLAFNNGGVAEQDPQQPNPLPFDGQGINVVAAATLADAANSQDVTAPATSPALTS